MYGSELAGDAGNKSRYLRKKIAQLEAYKTEFEKNQFDENAILIAIENIPARLRKAQSKRKDLEIKIRQLEEELIYWNDLQALIRKHQ